MVKIEIKINDAAMWAIFFIMLGLLLITIFWPRGYPPSPSDYEIYIDECHEFPAVWEIFWGNPLTDREMQCIADCNKMMCIDLNNNGNNQ